MFKKGHKKLTKELDILNILRNLLYFDTALFGLMSKSQKELAKLLA